MKRAGLIRHLEKCGCIFIREGGNHTIYKNPRTGKRHQFCVIEKLRSILAKKICDDLDVRHP